MAIWYTTRSRRKRSWNFTARRQVVEKVNKECDLSHSAATNFSFLFTASYQIFRTLRAQHPEWIADCVLVLLPSADKPLAQCALLPGGLGNVPVSKLTESAIDNLLEPMEGSRAQFDASAEQQETQVASCGNQSVANQKPFCFCSDDKLLMSNTSMRFVFL